MLKRRNKWLICSLIIFVIFCFGCGNKPNNATESGDIFSVNLIDVGEGDCIFIEFPDGKNMLIDSGENDDKVFNKINAFLKSEKVKKIDYLLITHPDSDHAGGAEKLVENYKISRAYLPDIDQEMFAFYSSYERFYTALKQTDTEIKNSDYYTYIKGENYCAAFLTPTPRAFLNSEYVEFNSSEAPSEEQSNALSPIIYMEICGERFVFTGDASEKQEKAALSNVRTLKAHYDYLGININLKWVDYLKVSHHGSSDASCQEFLNELCPKNAIISVGGVNNYGHPNTKVLTRLQTANPDYTLFRTDVHGNICVRGYRDGVKTVTERI